MPRPSKSTGLAIVGGFVALPNAVFQTPEFAQLSGRAVKLLIEVALQYRRGKANNGDLAITRTAMATRGFRSADQLMKARDELVNRGWLMVTRQGGRNIPSLYALTWLAIDRCGGKLDVPNGPMPPNLWKSENITHREIRHKPLTRIAEQVDPQHGTALARTTEQGFQH